MVNHAKMLAASALISPTIKTTHFAKQIQDFISVDRSKDDYPAMVGSAMRDTSPFLPAIKQIINKVMTIFPQ